MQLHTVCVTCGTPYAYAQQTYHEHPYHVISCSKCSRARMVVDTGVPLTEGQRVKMLEDLQMAALVPRYGPDTPFTYHGDLPVDPRDRTSPAADGAPGGEA